jgi:hypothetical protein
MIVPHPHPHPRECRSLSRESSEEPCTGIPSLFTSPAASIIPSCCRYPTREILAPTSYSHPQCCRHRWLRPTRCRWPVEKCSCRLLRDSQFTAHDLRCCITYPVEECWRWSPRPPSPAPTPAPWSTSDCQAPLPIRPCRSRLVSWKYLSSDSGRRSAHLQVVGHFFRDLLYGWCFLFCVLLNARV